MYECLCLRDRKRLYCKVNVTANLHIQKKLLVILHCFSKEGYFGLHMPHISSVNNSKDYIMSCFPHTIYFLFE